MKMIICPRKKHYYDTEKFSRCPYCSALISEDDTPTLSLESYDDDGPTVQLKPNEEYTPTVPFGPGEEDTPTQGIRDTNVTESSPKPEESKGKREEPRFWHLPDSNPGVTICLNEEADLTAGWLVCVEGASRGRDYRIVSGKNMVGREYSMPICIQGDETISRENHCSVIYDDKHNHFYLMPEKNTVSMNNKLLSGPVELNTGDEFIIGNSKFVFGKSIRR